jgi:formylglycine-generating enzyme required for sulfatase activity
MFCRVVFATVLSVAATSLSWGAEPVDLDTRTLLPYREGKAPDQADATHEVVAGVIPVTATFHVRDASVETIRHEQEMPQPLTVIDRLPRTRGGPNTLGAIHKQRGESRQTDFNVKFGEQASASFHLLEAALRLGGEGGDLITNSIGMKLKLIPAGRFKMGSPEDDKAASSQEGEKPQHEVTLTRPFYLGVYEVTQGEFNQITGRGYSYFSAVGAGRSQVEGMATDRLPVDTVSWIETIQFCNKLSAKEGLKPFYDIDGNRVKVSDWGGDGYRLPTEAEWEYACRAGTTTRFSFGDDEKLIGEHAWHAQNSSGRTHGVGEKKPNPFGLFDMHGNAWEWCWDWYEAKYYNSPSASLDPKGPEAGAVHVHRGGSFLNRVADLRSAMRRAGTPTERYGYNGFRAARNYY